MLLDADIKQQLEQYLGMLESDIVIQQSIGEDQVSKDMAALVDELAHMSPRIHIEEGVLERTPSFSVNRQGQDTGIVFAGIPLGHEFTSLVLALLQVSGRAPKIDQDLVDQIQAIKGKYVFETYVSLSCHNCPDVVQALNIMSVLNPGIRHTMIDGAAFKKEVEEKEIMAVPAVYLNGEFLESGRMEIEDLLKLIGESTEQRPEISDEPYDIFVIGGGPAGVSSAIYAARKGIRVGLLAERIGGQVLDTMGIENLISVPYTEGPKLANKLYEHLKHYDMDLILKHRVKDVRRSELIEIELDNGSVVKSKTAIIATGARWRNVNVPGEQEFKNKGVAYCPHCDGPFFEGKDVAVIGGGNSGIEAAIDLAGLAKHVTVLEFLPELKADLVLQKRLYSLPNVTVLKNVEIKAITGDTKVKGIDYMHRDTKESEHVELDGVFVQIGLIPNTEWLGEAINQNPFGEIITDARGATSLDGVYAAGDCTDIPYKQIVISMGSGATAALGAFDYLMRH
jgi:alkyl hydroperoxide reductase subunit F